MKKKRGLTLIELLAVIAIIAILFILLIPMIGSTIEKSRISGVQTDFRSYQIAGQSYFIEHIGEAKTIEKFNSYLDEPLRFDNGKSKELNPWNNPYQIEVTTDGLKIFTVSNKKVSFLDDTIYAQDFLQYEMTLKEIDGEFKYELKGFDEEVVGQAPTNPNTTSKTASASDSPLLNSATYTTTITLNETPSDDDFVVKALDGQGNAVLGEVVSRNGNELSVRFNNAQSHTTESVVVESFPSKTVSNQTNQNYSDTDGYSGLLTQYIHSGHNFPSSFVMEMKMLVDYNETTRPNAISLNNSSAYWTSSQVNFYLNEGSQTSISITNSDLSNLRTSNYTGTLNYLSELRVPSEEPGTDRRVVTYSGTVSGTAFDSRVWRYQGTVTKPDVTENQPRFKYTDIIVEYR